jgi:hypothetical protein
MRGMKANGCCAIGDHAFKMACLEGCVGVIGEAAVSARPAAPRIGESDEKVENSPFHNASGQDEGKGAIERESSSPFIFDDDPPPPPSLVDEEAAEMPFPKSKSRLKILGGTMMIIACAVVGEWCGLLVPRDRVEEGKKEVEDVCRVLCGMLDDEASVESGMLR